jgi:hypothetical protein
MNIWLLIVLLILFLPFLFNVNWASDEDDDLDDDLDVFWMLEDDAEEAEEDE